MTAEREAAGVSGDRREAPARAHLTADIYEGKKTEYLEQGRGVLPL
jgi:hypothetical protein